MSGNSLSKIAKSRSGIIRLLSLTILTEMFVHSCWAQDLAPRASQATCIQYTPSLPLVSACLNPAIIFSRGRIHGKPERIGIDSK